MHLDPAVFQPASVNVRNYPQTQVDPLIRSGLMDSLIARELLEMGHLLFPRILDELTSQLGAEVVSPSLSLLEDLICFTSFNTDRSICTQMAALSNNKLSLRDQVLKRFSAPPSSAKILRGLSFAGGHLFGPLPESFSASLQTVAGQSLVCKAAGASASQVSTPKRSPVGGYPPAKRRRFSYTTASPSTKFFRGQQKRGSKGSKSGRGKN